VSKITNDCLTRSVTGCFKAVPIWQQWASKGYIINSMRSVVLRYHVVSGQKFLQEVGLLVLNSFDDKLIVVADVEDAATGAGV